MSSSFEYSFPSIRGIQAKREYYVSMCPMSLIPKIFLFNEEEVRPDVRAQRTLNKQRIPEMTRYLVNNDEDYVFSAITASIDSDVKFIPVDDSDSSQKIGILKIPMTAQFIINDGQHRRAAIEAALNEKPELADESIAVVFFLDQGLDRSQQMFADLNKHAIRPGNSLNVLYDKRDTISRISSEIAYEVPIFRDLIELEKSSLAKRSSKLFTLSNINSGNKVLLKGLEHAEDELLSIAIEFWNYIGSLFSDWQKVKSGDLKSSDVRSDKIHAHGVIIQALGIIGNYCIVNGIEFKKLEGIKNLDWSRSNRKFWEGRALDKGRVSKNSKNITLTVNIIKKHLGLSLTDDERKNEIEYIDFLNNGVNNE